MLTDVFYSISFDRSLWELPLLYTGKNCPYVLSNLSLRWLCMDKFQDWMYLWYRGLTGIIDLLLEAEIRP